MECVECRNTGVTKRGVCPKCPAGQRFLERSDGGIRLALQPEFAKRFAAEPRRINDVAQNVAEMTPEVRAEYERARVKLGLAEQGELADREAAPPAVAELDTLRQNLAAAEARELDHIRQQELMKRDLAAFRELAERQAADIKALSVLKTNTTE